jgi:phosphoribosyl 1,2-cyclic phosphodiesterase
LQHHLDTTTAAKTIQEAKPKQAVLTHFGMLMLNKGPELEAYHIQQTTGIPTTAAQDNSKITI